MPSNYPGSLDAFTTGTLTGVVSGSDHGNKGDALNKIEAELGVTPSGTAATVVSRLDLMEGGVYNAKRYGVVADGATDDTAAWNALIALLPDGACVTWTGLSVVQPGIEFIGRVAVCGRGVFQSAFKIAGGTTTNDGIKFGGTDGPRYGHTLRDFSIVGAASCCADALVLVNLVDPVVDNVWVKAGATGYGASIEGVQNGKSISLTVTHNTNLGFTGSPPVNGIRVIGSALIPSNANTFRFVTESLAGDGIVGDATVGAAGSNNNMLVGVSQGNGGKNVSLKQWTDFSLRDFHSEAATGTELYLELCQRGHIGSGAFVDGLTHLVNCHDIRLDGFTTTSLTVDSACTGIRRGRYELNGGTDSDSHLLSTVASATTTTLSHRYDVFIISGSTTITSITASWPGRRVTLIFSSTAQLTDGSNLKLASNFTGTGDRTISLVSNGTNWYETGRSAN